jgi:hypothetical protein
MAPTPAAASAANDDGAPLRPVHICFERILPDELDPERLVRRELRRHLAGTTSALGTLDPNDASGVARMALVLSKKWTPGATVRCRFLDGSAKMRAKVQKYAKQWEHYAAIKLSFVASGDAEVRISFYADAGSWSAVGRDALNAGYFPLHQPTMNYGWLRDDTDDEEYRRVVLHEFGHALGCVHEHQQPKFDRKWNVAAVMKYFSGPPNYWSPADIKSNVLSKYSSKGMAATLFDPDSIMLYEFDAALFADGKGATNTNTQVSKTDVKMIGEMYPKPAPPAKKAKAAKKAAKPA